jgi:hypothetical protein
VVVYIDDILIYSKSLVDHLDHLRGVFNALRDARLYGNLDKCTFCTNRVAFLAMLLRNRELKLIQPKLKQLELAPAQDDHTSVEFSWPRWVL